MNLLKYLKSIPGRLALKSSNVMLANYLDSILYAHINHPERVADEVARLRADLNAIDKFDKLVSIIGVAGEDLVNQLKGENAALRSDIVKLKKLTGPVSAPKPSAYSAAQVIRLTRSLSAATDKIASLKTDLASSKLEIKELKKDLKEALAAPGEVTSPRVAAAAARVLQDASSSADARAIAASALTQARNKPKS